jgi:hypothetical protein
MSDEPMPPLFTKKGPLPMQGPSEFVSRRPTPRTPPVVVEAEVVAPRAKAKWPGLLIALAILAALIGGPGALAAIYAMSLGG